MTRGVSRPSGVLRMALQTSRPSPSGSALSITTRSGRTVEKRVAVSAAVEVRRTSNPACSRCRQAARRAAGSRSARSRMGRCRGREARPGSRTGSRRGAKERIPVRPEGSSRWQSPSAGSRWNGRSVAVTEPPIAGRMTPALLLINPGVDRCRLAQAVAPDVVVGPDVVVAPDIVVGPDVVVAPDIVVGPDVVARPDLPVGSLRIAAVPVVGAHPGDVVSPVVRILLG